MNSKILRKNKRNPLHGMSRAETLDYLKTSLAGKCQAAYLYGSFARDDLHADSDIDCMIVAETETPFTERAHEFGDLRLTLPSLEILVYTPEEFASLTENPSTGFWQSVVKDLMQIVES